MSSDIESGVISTGSRQRGGHPRFERGVPPLANLARIRSRPWVESDGSASELLNTIEADEYELLSGWSEETSVADPFDLKAKRMWPLNHIADKRVVAFYKKQNSLIDRLLTSPERHARLKSETAQLDEFLIKLIIGLSSVAILLLAPFQVYNASTAGSLALIVGSLDAAASLLSYSVISLCRAEMWRVDTERFPVGKMRIETMGHIAFGFLMVVPAVSVMVMSLQRLSIGSQNSPQTHVTGTIQMPSLIVACIAVAVNLVFYVCSMGIVGRYCLVETLRSDFREKLLLNAVGALTSVGGAKLVWWIDPLGAAYLSCHTIIHQSSSAWSHMQIIVGKTADAGMLQHITYLALTHDPRVAAIRGVRAWYSGSLIIVEVEIVMDRDQKMAVCHDAATLLQMKLETLPYVERAYVHVDYDANSCLHYSL